MNASWKAAGMVLLLLLPDAALAQTGFPSGDRTQDSLTIVREAEFMMPDSVLDWVGMSREEFVRMSLRAATSPESIFMGPDRAHRSDAQMSAQFLAHEADFLRLLTMFQADTAFDAITTRTWDFSQTMKRVPSERYAEYDRCSRARAS